MKNMRKNLALALALMMVLAMGASALAASIELKKEPADFADSHTYKVYQIFTGVIGTDE